MSLIRRAAIALSFLTLLVPKGHSTEMPAADLNDGKASFDMQCARCHGAQGKGDGPDAKRVPVPPRDLTSGVFKFKSTEQGTPPSDDDLLWTLNHGMSGAGMPSFASLSIDTKRNLIAYVKTHSPAFSANAQPKPVASPNLHARVDLKKGKELFDKFQCALCHGGHGQANGTSAATLVDGWGHKLKPANLTHGWTYRAGDDAHQIYNRLMVGIDGGAMPSFQPQPDDAWQIANYVMTLQLKPNFSAEIHAHEVKGNLPTTFDDAAWDQAKRTDVNVQGQSYVEGKKFVNSVNAVSVQALYNDKAIAFRFFWSDQTKDENGAADAFLMAIKPAALQVKHNQNLHTLYQPSDAALDLYQWSAASGNQVRQTISNLASASSARNSNTFDAVSEYRDGLWTLVFSRPLNAKDAEAIEGKPLRVGFEIADGGNNETGTRRPASQWISLQLGDVAEHH